MSTKKIIENAKRKGIILHEDHKLVTRRDFLGAGIIPFSAAIMAPTVLSTLLKASIAEAACPTSTTQSSSLVPFIQLHASGGCDSTHIMPMKQDGSLLARMDLMGKGTLANQLLDTNNTAAARTFLGVDRWFFRSQFLAGLRTELALTAGLENNVSVIYIANQSRDDSGDNKMGLDSLISRAGLVGSGMNVLVAQGRGNLSAFDPPPPPLQVGTVADLANAVGINIAGFNSAQKVGFFGLIKSLSDRRALELLGSNAAVVRELTGCATSSNLDAADNTAPTTDASQIAAYQQIWGINANTNGGDRNKVFASCAYNTLMKQAGVSNLQIGGYDYHDNTRTTGDTRDGQAGQMIGRLLRTAAQAGSKLALLFTTDGSVRSQMSDGLVAPWVSDRGQASGQYLFLYDPAGKPSLNQGTEASASMATQIGYFTDGQSADMNYLGGKWGTETAALAIFANYLKFSLGNNYLPLYKTVTEAAALAAGMSNPLPAEAGAGNTNPDILKILRVA